MKKENDILFYALGGIGEVGKNCYCIEQDDEIIIIDCGSLFPDDNMHGIDLILPNFERLINNKDKIVGLFITHAHEDHIGGIPYLLKQIPNIKIFCNGVAEALIRRKCEEHNVNPNIVLYHEKAKVSTKHFVITFFTEVHSIPDAYGLIIKTEYGNIIHTGDYKFDFTPIGHRTNFKKISKAASEGVLCLLSDSTNSLLSGFTQSEKAVGNSIKDIFFNSKSRIIVATFATNMHRVQQIVEASVATGRKILIFGRSMESNIKIGEEINYIKAPQGTFIQANQMNMYENHELTILCTGSQGETLAALSRIAQGVHKDIQIIPGDTVIFSSSPIPGNQQNVSKTINGLFLRGANVIVNSPLADTHTSGHAAKLEQLLMLSLTDPKYFIPIHGEYHMLKTHANTGMEYGIPEENCFVLEGNGDVIAFNDKEAYFKEHFPCEDVFLDGNITFEVDNQILRQRKTLAEHGVVAIIQSINSETYQMTSRTLVISRGFIYMKTNEEIINQIRSIADAITLGQLANKTFTKQVCVSKIYEAVSNYIQNHTERKPIIAVKIMQTNGR